MQNWCQPIALACGTAAGLKAQRCLITELLHGAQPPSPYCSASRRPNSYTSCQQLHGAGTVTVLQNHHVHMPAKSSREI
jgi:hypothetical protein